MGLVSLITLDLSSNQLTELNASLPNTLTSLNLHENQLTLLKPSLFDHLAELKKLDLSKNKLTHLTRTYLRVLST